MIRHEGERLQLEGALTNGNVAGLLDAAKGAVLAGATIVDLAAVTQVDSAAIAFMLELTRTADRSLRLINVPEGLVKLARLYGVDGLLLEAPR